MEDDVTYFARRASEERETAMRASDLRARQVHLQMAERYQDLATSIEERERFLALRGVGDGDRNERSLRSG